MTGLRILVCCPNGAGISLMLESMVQSAARQIPFPIQTLHHGSIREGRRVAGAFDLVLCPQSLVPQLDIWQGTVTILGLENPLSPRELGEKLTDLCRRQGWGFPSPRPAGPERPQLP